MFLHTPEGRLAASGALASVITLALAGLLALVVVDYETIAPEFVELNLGRLSTQQLTQLMRQAERAAESAAPDERTRAPHRRLPEVEVPSIAPSEVERRLVPDRVSLDEERLVTPPRPSRSGVPELHSLVRPGNRVLYEGSQIDLGPSPGEGIESTHVGSDIQPVFVIEGQLKGRDFHEAAITAVPDIPARTQVHLDLTVAPSGAVISALVARKENAALEAFATDYIRRCRFDRLPTEMPQENQTGRIVITFAPQSK
jgi:hypothetical protein